MKTKKLITSKLLLIGIAIFLFGATSCAKKNITKDLSGNWTVETMTTDGVDVFDEMGGSIDGTWTFSKDSNKEGSIDYAMVYNFGSDSETETGNSSYKIIDKETIEIDFDSEIIEMTIDDLTESKLVLAYTDDSEIKYVFSK
ncbi:hypothetical protein N8987_00615 [Crocinitomix sp.]|nr:hypothetical protein [Crocinitomix sp.]